MKQTAVEWYEKEVNALIDKYEAKEISKRDFIIMKHNLFYPAKEMEKEQIEEAYTNALTGSIDPRWVEIHKKQAEQYYKQTFKSE